MASLGVVGQENEAKELEGNSETVEVKVSWLGGKKSRVRVRDLSLVIDNPEDRGGTNEGPRPTETLLASLGGCFAITLSRIAERMRIKVSNLELTLAGSVRRETHNIDSIDISVRIRADQTDPIRLGRLIKLAKEYCTVSNTLEKPTGIKVRLEPDI